jgi:hypothetical protein
LYYQTKLRISSLKCDNVVLVEDSVMDAGSLNYEMIIFNVINPEYFLKYSITNLTFSVKKKGKKEKLFL